MKNHCFLILIFPRYKETNSCVHIIEGNTFETRRDRFTCQLTIRIFIGQLGYVNYNTIPLKFLRNLAIRSPPLLNGSLKIQKLQRDSLTQINNWRAWKRNSIPGKFIRHTRNANSIKGCNFVATVRRLKISARYKQTESWTEKICTRFLENAVAGLSTIPVIQVQYYTRERRNNSFRKTRGDIYLTYDTAASVTFTQ